MAKLELRKAYRLDDGELTPKAVVTIPDEDFIPFVCHYDENTILTKNGELLQVIRITGFNHESVSSELINLRETIRESITQHIKSNNFALWLHTIRRKQNITPEGHFPDFFSAQLNEIWEEENNWKHQYVNELYLTILIKGYNTSIVNFNSLLRSFSVTGTKNLHIKELQKAHHKLSTTCGEVLKDLNEYGAELLGYTEINDGLHSEHMSFFGKIVSLCETDYPLAINDIASDLAHSKLAFGNTSLEVVCNEKKHFASMFSIKEYSEISVGVLDNFLQIPQEYIITQSIDFIDRNKALMEFDYQHYILDVSGDEQLKHLSGLESVIESDTGSPTDYGEQQITIMLINKTARGLQKDIETALERLYELGLVTVREDIFSEHCFWSQLPGNFAFLRRQKPINTKRIAGFASLHNFPAGNRRGNYWGNAVSIFRTVLGTPYFFSFHDGDKGHTLIVGPYGSGKTVLLNFLVSQSRKFHNKLYYFGHNRAENIFINAIGGNYLSMTKNNADPYTLKLNPLHLEDSEDSKKFISEWLKYLVISGEKNIDEAELKLIPEIVEKIISAGIKKLSDAAPLFNQEETKNIYQKLLPWHSSGKYAFIFDNDEENDWSNNLVNAFNLTPILPYQHILIPIITYLLYKIETTLDGKPTMIVLDEAWNLIDNYALGPQINKWLGRMRKKNCIVIFATESVLDAAQSSITKNINDNIATRIFLPDPNPTEYYQTVFGLGDEEFELLAAMSSEDRHFLLKHGEDSVIASLDLSNIEEVTTVLSSRPSTLMVMEEVMKEFGHDPQEWLSNFFEVIQHHEEDGEDEA
jgi:type IV secretion system protein VirB4